MFTGIIEAVGTVHRIRQTGVQMRLTVDIGQLAEGTRLGDSIAVNGVCLTVCQLAAALADFDISSETVAKSSLKNLTVGSKVNLERAMRADGRFGGHMVQGHVDGIGKIAAIRKQADYAEFRFEANTDLLNQMVLKGSVAVDGISVTIAKLNNTGFEVAVIPTTLKETTWHLAKVGDTVNIEADILVKIIQRQLNSMLGDSKGLTLDKLREQGF